MLNFDMMLMKVFFQLPPVSWSNLFLSAGVYRISLLCFLLIHSLLCSLIPSWSTRLLIWTKIFGKTKWSLIAYQRKALEVGLNRETELWTSDGEEIRCIWKFRRRSGWRKSNPRTSLVREFRVRYSHDILLETLLFRHTRSSVIWIFDVSKRFANTFVFSYGFRLRYKMPVTMKNTFLGDVRRLHFIATVSCDGCSL